MNKITVSAPGKLMLFGEHAVVYGHPCIVTAVDQRMILDLEPIKDRLLILDALDLKIKNYKKPLVDLGKGEIPKAASFVEMAVKNFMHQFEIPAGIKLTTRSEFKSTFGFGSSSAVTVCAVKALEEFCGFGMVQKDIFDLCYKTVLDVQGKGSGFDVASAIYGGTIYFVKGGSTIESLGIKNLPLIVGYTGIKADTVTLIDKVNHLQSNYPEIVKNIFRLTEDIVLMAKDSLNNGDLEKTGELFNLNQGLLESLGVGSTELSRLVYAANNAGAFGSKLSGAGGGDCMISLCAKSKEYGVIKAIENAGGQIIEVSTNAEGVRVEN